MMTHSKRRGWGRVCGPLAFCGLVACAGDLPLDDEREDDASPLEQPLALQEELEEDEGSDAAAPEAELSDEAIAAEADAEASAMAAAELGVSASASSVPNRVGVLTWNICGATKTCNGSAYPERKIDELVDHVLTDSSIGVVMIQEACESIHSRPLERELNRRTRSTWVVQHRTAIRLNSKKTAVTCPVTGKPEAGVAIAVRAMPGSKFDRWNTRFKSVPEKNGAHSQGAACVQDTANKLLACTAHFANENNDGLRTRRAASARDFRDKALWFQRRGYRTIIGGDFNLDRNAPEVRVLYDGNFEADTDDKCDTMGPPTCRSSGGHKYDYIFFSDFGWDLERGDVQLSGSNHYLRRELSDHWILEGIVKRAAR